MIVQVEPFDLIPDTRDRYFACGPLTCPPILVFGGAAEVTAACTPSAPATSATATAIRMGIPPLVTKRSDDGAESRRCQFGARRPTGCSFTSSSRAPEAPRGRSSPG